MTADPSAGNPVITVVDVTPRCQLDGVPLRLKASIAAGLCCCCRRACDDIDTMVDPVAALLTGVPRKTA